MNVNSAFTEDEDLEWRFATDRAVRTVDNIMIPDEDHHLDLQVGLQWLSERHVPLDSGQSRVVSGPSAVSVVADVFLS
jgi:hypothetical protein